MSNKNIDDLRAILFDTIDAVKNGKMDIEKAKCISGLSKVMVQSAKVEVDFAKATGSKGSGFLDKAPALPPGITGVTQHRVK